MVHKRVRVQAASRPWRQPVSVIEIDIDDEALAIAMRHLGTRSPQDAVNAVLREYVMRAGQAEAAERDLRR
ncbi:hypothetical protein GCM10010442_32280 [Kitasatospora kifunensis]